MVMAVAQQRKSARVYGQKILYLSDVAYEGFHRESNR